MSRARIIVGLCGVSMLSMAANPLLSQPAAPASATERPTHPKAWKYGGDTRLRYELDTRRPGLPDRERGRLRLRLTATGPLSPTWDAGVRARTGSPSTPFSANVSLFNSLDEPEASGFNVDQAYAHYHPKGKHGLQLGLGKSPQFFGDATPYDSLMWAADYNPLGVWGGYEQERGWIRGGFYTLERLPRYVGSQLVCVESSIDILLAEPSRKLRLEAGYYGFLLDAPVTPFRNRGNATITGPTGEGFRSEFRLVEPQITYKFWAWKTPFTASAYYIYNAGARTENDAASVGITAGETRRRGDWSAFTRYQIVEQDAVFTPVAQDDFPLASNFRGVTGGVSHQLRKNQRVDAWFLTAERLEPAGCDQFRGRVELNARF